MTAPERLRAWRGATKTTQASLARSVGCDHTTLSRIENGDAFPVRAVANAIERVTAGHALGPIKAEDWDDLEKAAKSAAT